MASPIVATVRRDKLTLKFNESPAEALEQQIQ
jgi:hypothetical protein